MNYLSHSVALLSLIHCFDEYIHLQYLQFTHYTYIHLRLLQSINQAAEQCSTNFELTLNLLIHFFQNDFSKKAKKVYWK